MISRMFNIKEPEFDNKLKHKGYIKCELKSNLNREERFTPDLLSDLIAYLFGQIQ